MRLWVLAILVITLAVLLFLWYYTGRPRPIAVTLVVLLLVPLGWFEWRWWQTESAANSGAVVVAGSQSAGVHCQRLSEAWFYARAAIGWVGMDGDGNPQEALLTYEVCRDLRSWLESDKSDPSRDEVIAVHVVAHEAAHLAGIWDESMAECVAMRDGVAVAMTMGATLEQAERLVERYRTEIHPTLRSEYTRAVQC